MQFDTRSLWLYLYFPQLQLDVLEQQMAQVNAEKANPNNKENISNHANTPAIAIVDSSKNEICQLNHFALQQGVKHGMGLASASLLYPDLCLHEYQSDIETHNIHHIANKLYLITADIALLPPKAIALRVQNMLQLYDNLETYWRVIEQSLMQQQLHFVAATAYSIQSAKLLALNGHTIITDDRQKIHTTLCSCLIQHSDIDAKDLQKLARIGIHSYQDLQALPAADTANRVSRFSMSVINELAGKQASKLKFYHPLATYHDYCELLYDISIVDKLLPFISRCIQKLTDFLLIANAHTLSIELCFFQREHEPLSYTVNSIRPIYKCKDWIDIIGLQLESVKFLSPVYGLSVRCDKYETLEVANDDMFEEKSTHVAALTLLSRLQGKLGKTRIQQLRFVSDFRPEKAISKHALSHQHTNEREANGHDRVSLGLTKSKYSIFADRPGLLLPTPEPLAKKVHIIKGPERIQTGWWDDNHVNRDYYIAQTSGGQQVWIFKTPSKEWYLHGYFV